MTTTKNNPFEGKTTVIIKVHPWMCNLQPSPLPFPPHADRSSRADERNPKGRQRNLGYKEQTAAQMTYRGTV